MHILLNNKGIFCLHIFVYVLFSCRIDFIVSGGKLVDGTPITNSYPITFSRSWAIIMGLYIAKAIWPLNMHYHFVSLNYSYWCVYVAFYSFLTENTTILEQNDKQKSKILEAFFIRMKQPKVNRINFKCSTNVLKYI